MVIEASGLQAIDIQKDTIVLDHRKSREMPLMRVNKHADRRFHVYI